MEYPISYLTGSMIYPLDTSHGTHRFHGVPHGIAECLILMYFPWDNLLVRRFYQLAYLVT